MHRQAAIVVTILALVLAGTAYADLQSVRVGGSIKIRGNYYSGAYGLNQSGGLYPSVAWRWRDLFLSGRPTGAGFKYGNFVGDTILSSFGWNDDLKSDAFVSQRSRVFVDADFTDSVSAFIEFDSNDRWGEDFRSDYITGIDGRASTADDLEIYQAYIETEETFGVPLRLRIGRQEISLGNAWLVGPNAGGQKFLGVSFDAVRATYETEQFSLDAFASKLEERGVAEEDGDIDLYGLYGRYQGLERFTFDAYWLYLRDAISHQDTTGIISDWLEDLLDVDDYDPVGLHTVGLRAEGYIGNFDWMAEVAYQFGDAGRVGAPFKPYNLLNTFFGPSSLLGRNRYGDDEADFDAWGADLVLTYTFAETKWTPSLFLNLAYLGGEDQREVSFLEWLECNINPFYVPEASLSFNRLFSDVEYSMFLELDASLSNAWIAGAGASIWPTEKTEFSVRLYHFETLEEFKAPYHFEIGDLRIVPFFPFSFIDEENDTDLGWELDLRLRYEYSEDLSFLFGWSHLFVGDGLAEGNFSDGHGLFFNGGTDDDDADYVYAQALVMF